MLPKATALIANDPNYEFNLNYSIPPNRCQKAGLFFY